MSYIKAETYSAARGTAIHEAGHAVMGYLLGRTFKTISVVEDGDSWGRVEYTPPGDWFRPDLEITARVRSRVEDSIMIGLAGAVTERQWLLELSDRPDDWKEQMDVGAAHDNHGVVHLALYMCGSEDETSAYVEWWLVTALADAAQERGQMSWRAARETLRDADLAMLAKWRGRSPVFKLPD